MERLRALKSPGERIEGRWCVPALNAPQAVSVVERVRERLLHGSGGTQTRRMIRITLDLDGTSISRRGQNTDRDAVSQGSRRVIARDARSDFERTLDVRNNVFRRRITASRKD